MAYSNEMVATGAAVGVDPAIAMVAGSDASNYSRLLRIIAPAVAVVSLMGACGSGDKTPKAGAQETTTTTLTAEQVTAADAVCEVDLNMQGAESNKLTDAGSPESIFPALSTVEKGTSVLKPKDEVRKIMLEGLCTKPFDLAAVTAYAIEPRDTLVLPNENTLARVEELRVLYASNPGAALAAVQKVAANLDFLTGTNEKGEEFGVTQGQAAIVAPILDTDKTILGAKPIDVNVNGLLDGFKIGFNDVKSLTPEQRTILKQIKDLVLFDKDGRLVVRQWIGTTEVRFNLNAPLEAKANPDEENAAGGQEDRKATSGTGTKTTKTGSTGTQTTGTNGGGVQTGTQGCGIGTVDCGGGSGTTTGNQGPTGPGAGPGGGETTPATNPPTTNPPETAPPTTSPPPTSPPTTSPPPTSPPTTEAPKGTPPTTTQQNCTEYTPCS